MEIQRKVKKGFKILETRCIVDQWDYMSEMINLFTSGSENLSCQCGKNEQKIRECCNETIKQANEMQNSDQLWSMFKYKFSKVKQWYIDAIKTYVQKNCRDRELSDTDVQCLLAIFINVYNCFVVQNVVIMHDHEEGIELQLERYDGECDFYMLRPILMRYLDHRIDSVDSFLKCIMKICNNDDTVKSKTK